MYIHTYAHINWNNIYKCLYLGSESFVKTVRAEWILQEFLHLHIHLQHTRRPFFSYLTSYRSYRFQMHHLLLRMCMCGVHEQQELYDASEPVRWSPRGGWILQEVLGEGEPEHAGCMDNPRSCTENESCQPISRGQGILPQKTIFWRGCPNTQIGLWKSLVDWSPLSLGGHSSFPWTFTNNFPPQKCWLSKTETTAL